MSIVLTCDERNQASGLCNTCGATQHDNCRRHPMAPDVISTTSCKWCGKQTRMTGTRQCDSCWELSSRIERDPDMAMRILQIVRPVTGRCVCTGILVHTIHQHPYCYAHADLFDMGTHWVIQRAAWQIYDQPFGQTTKLIQVGDPCLERNNVIVAPKTVCRLNDAAKEYINDQ